MILRLNEADDKRHMHGIMMVSTLLREKMFTAGEKCAHGLIHHAAVTRNKALRKKVQIILADLLHLKRAAMDVTCELICIEAEENISSTGKRGYTAEDVRELRNYIERYRKTLPHQQHRIKAKREMKEMMEGFVNVRKRVA